MAAGGGAKNPTAEKIAVFVLFYVRRYMSDRVRYLLILSCPMCIVYISDRILSMKKKQVIRVILILCISLIFGFGMYRVSSSAVGNGLPMPFGVGLAVVQSGSMEPELSVGDLLIVIRDSGYEVGDVIIFQQGSGLVVHRIVEINGNEMITRGDANNTEDPPILLEDIKGRVLTAVPYAGYVADVLRSAPMTILLLAAAVYFYVMSVISDRREMRRRAEAEKARLAEEIERLKRE